MTKPEELQNEEVDPRCKVFVSRIPSRFTEDTVRRLVESKVGGGSVVDVGLKFEVDERVAKKEEKKEDDRFQREPKKKKKLTNDETTKAHKGYAFLQFQTPEQATSAVELGKIRGGIKEGSTKKHTLYINAVDKDDDEKEEAVKHVCFLWQNHRCPYGDTCKFAHEGEGGCLVKKEKSEKEDKKSKRCWEYKKGKCKLGDECPFSHEFEVEKKAEEKPHSNLPKSEKDCINWKTKGKCRKGEKCPYRHDEAVREKLLAKKNKKRPQESQDSSYKRQQPLSVRVFGLNYESTEADVCGLFDGCGKVTKITFPAFEDSGRSKGYCEVLFSSPKAVSEAVKLNETELHGRWLSVQAGKMYLKQWENHERGGEDGDGDAKRRRH